MASGFSTPVQCSDDTGAQLSYQTGREIDTSNGSQKRQSLNLQTDAERDNAQGYQAGAGDARDTIEIKGEKSIIIATGLAAAMKPGAVFQFGNENHMTFYGRPGYSSPQAERGTRFIQNKYSITGSQEEPKLEHLDFISGRLAGDFRQLGRKLGLDDHTIDQISMDYHAEGQHEINYRILMKWKQMYSPVTLQKLATSLVQIGRGDLADELRHG